MYDPLIDEFIQILKDRTKRKRKRVKKIGEMAEKETHMAERERGRQTGRLLIKKI